VLTVPSLLPSAFARVLYLLVIMFGFHHRRGRSLISVRDMEKMEEGEKTVVVTEDEVDEKTYRTPAQRRNLIMIYLLFLAEGIMAASLSSQIEVLVPVATGCMGMDASFLRSIFECAYFLGSAFGVFWGWATDRAGRRKVAIVGLSGMAICCFSMGFATNFGAFATLRFVAGAISSAVTVAGLSMLADATHGSSDRISAVAKLPLIAVFGGVGPLAATALRHFSPDDISGAFSRFPGLSGQLVCGSLVLLIGIAEVTLLEETLPPIKADSFKHEDYRDSEKAAFLGQSLPHDSDESLDISIVEALQDDTATPLPSHITITQLITAPSVMLLLASYAILSLHTSTFDILLPHLGHTASHEGGMAIPCDYATIVIIAIKAVAAFRLVKFVPAVVSKIGLLPMYRKISLAFPIMYLLVPLVGLVVSLVDVIPLIVHFASFLVISIKAIYAGAAQILVVLLILSAAPDASSTGTVIGVVSIAELFKALAVGISGMSYFLSDDYSVSTINFSLWIGLAAIATAGGFVSWKLRETPRVGTDIPEHCLSWQGMFDAESDEEAAF
jgi:MFS family permease